MGKIQIFGKLCNGKMLILEISNVNLTNNILVGYFTFLKVFLITLLIFFSQISI